MASYTLTRLTTSAFDADGTTGVTAATAADDFAWPTTDPDEVILIVRNGAATGSDTVAADSDAVVTDGLAQSNRSVVVAAGKTVLIPLSKAFVQRSGGDQGNVLVTHTAPANVHCAVVHF